MYLIHLLGTWLAVAAISLAIDFVYARWQLSMAEGRAYPAMFWSAACPILGCASLWLWLHDPFTVIPNALGCAAGTWLAMRWK